MNYELTVISATTLNPFLTSPLECDASGQRIIWLLAKDLWCRKNLLWPTLTLGSILCCAICDPRDASGRALPGANRSFYHLTV